MRAGRCAAVTLAVGLAVSGCSSSGGIADRAAGGGDANYIAGDGSVEKLALERRGAPVELSGPSLAGTPLNVADLRGKVVVVNTWASWCKPCEDEAPHLVTVWKKESAARRGVQFVGVNIGEGPQTGAAAAQRLGLGFPSISDRDRATGAALQNKATATPTTLVLDRQGRIAARVSGALTTPSTLSGLIDDVVAEHA